jgi:cleavage and polyadenylation specificity factor subunit 1
MAVDGLPYGSVSLLPYATSFGGVVVTTSNSIIYVDRAARHVSLPVNSWAARVSDMSMPPADKGLGLCLGGSRLMFVNEKTQLFERMASYIVTNAIVCQCLDY